MKINYVNWSPELFEGFYESGLYNSDTLYSINADFVEDKEPEYDFVEGGFDKFCEDVTRGCVEALFDNLDQGDGEIIKTMTFKKLHSPRYYNFETDKFEAEVDIDWPALMKWTRKRTDKFAEYLAENFTSRSGFISFVPNTTDAFFDALGADFDRLADVLIEFYILSNLDVETYRDACREIAWDVLWNYIAPVEPDTKTLGLKTENK